MNDDPYKNFPISEVTVRVSPVPFIAFLLLSSNCSVKLQVKNS